MARVSLVLNVVLLGVIVGLLTTRKEAAPAWSGVETEMIPGGGLRVLEAPGGRGGFILDFGVDIAGAAADAVVTEELVVLEPKAAITERWRSPRQLEIRPSKPLRRASPYEAILARELRTSDGHPIPRGSRARFETAPLRLEHAVIIDDEGQEGPDVMLDFDLPVDLVELGQALKVRTEAGAPLAYMLEGMPGADQTAIRVRFADPAAAARTTRFELTLARGLKARGLPLPLGQDLVRTLALAEPLKLTAMHAREGAIDLEFSHAVPLPERSFVTLEPTRPFTILRTWSGLSLVGDFPPGEPLAVTLAAGFPDKGRARLVDAVRRAVLMPDRTPTLAIKGEGRVLSAKARPEIVVEAVNVTRAVLEIRSVSPGNAVRYAQESGGPHPGCFDESRKITLDFPARKNVVDQRTIDLAPILGARLLGVHELRLDAVDGETETVVRDLQITDLGVSARATGDAVAVHCRSLAKGEPVAGALVRVVSTSNLELGSARTDPRGVAILRFPTPDPERRPYLIEVRKDQDRTVVDVDGFGVALKDDALGGRAPLGRGIEAYVAFDRGIVRPGDPLRASVVVRDAEGRAPVDRRLEARWLTPDQRVVRRDTATLDAAGLAAFVCPTGNDAPTGTWRLDVADAESGATIGSEAVRVETFIPDRIAVSAAIEGPLDAGDTAEVTVKARWLDGGGTGPLPLTVRPRFDFAVFAPPSAEGFVFGRPPAPGLAPPGEAAPIETVLDAEGNARIQFTLPAETAEIGALVARLDIEVADPSGRVARAEADAPVRPQGTQVGLRLHGDALELRLVDGSGAPVTTPTEVRLAVEARRVESRFVARRRGVGVESDLAREVLDETRVTVENGFASLPRPRPALSEGSSGHVVARVGSSVTEVALASTASILDRLRVQAPSLAIPAGRRTTITVESPIAGHAFLTLEAGTVLEAWTAPVTAGRTELPVTLPEHLAVPNVHVVVTVTAAQARRGFEGPWWLCAGTSIAVDHRERRAAVTLDAPGTVRPESKLAVVIDAPGANSATVAVVDEGVLRLTSHPAPDPHGWLHARRRLTGIGADTGSALRDGPRFDDGVLVGGGGDDVLEARLGGGPATSIETVALFAVIPLDAAGHAVAEFTLPSYEGRVRIDVIAAGARVTGAASRTVDVAAPLGLQLAGPRFLAPGDRADLVVTLRNRSEAPGRVELSIDPGPTLVLADAAAAGRNVEIPAGGTVNERVAVVARAEGRSTFRATARLGEETRTRTLDLPIRLLGAYEVERLGLAAPDGTSEVEIPGRWSSGEAVFTLGGGPEHGLLPLLEGLRRYPYGCCEQTSSVLRGLLACQGLLSRFYPEGGGEVRDEIATSVDRLLSMQTPQGGLAWWPGGYEDYPYGSVLGLDLLLAARAAGEKVPDAPLARLADRVQRLLRAEDDPGLRAAAAEALARAGRPVARDLRALALEATDREDRARVALGLALVGETGLAARMLDGDPDETAEEGGTRTTSDEEAIVGATRSGSAERGERPAGVATRPTRAGPRRDANGYLRSPARRTALELTARLAATPTSPRIPALAATLANLALAPGALTTQEQGFLLAALARYHAAHASPKTTTRVTITVGGRAYDLAPGKPLSIPVSGGERAVVTADGPVFGLVEVRGQRIDAGAEAALGLGLARKIALPRETAPVARFERGKVYEVTLHGHALEAVENALVTDVLPAGFEIEPRELWMAGDQLPLANEIFADRVERRDDRVLWFVSGRLGGPFVFRYRVRAVFSGTFAPGVSAAEALYLPGAKDRVPAPEPITIHDVGR